MIEVAIDILEIREGFKEQRVAEYQTVFRIQMINQIGFQMIV